MKKKGFMRVVLALLMSMLLIVSTGCGKSGNGESSSGKKSGKTATLADMNEIPEDGIITKDPRVSLFWPVSGRRAMPRPSWARLSTVRVRISLMAAR